MLRLLPKSFWVMLLRYFVLGLVLFGLVFAGAQLISGLGYKARAAALEAELKEVRADLTLCGGSKAILEGVIESRKRAYEAMLERSNLRFAAAERNEELAEIARQKLLREYDELEASWPTDCVEAIELVRVRRGL